MKLEAFNAIYDSHLKIEPGYRKPLWVIMQWCPNLNMWIRVPSSFFDCGRAHFESETSDVPSKIIESARIFANDGFRSNHILVERGKHGNTYYNASTTENLISACVKILSVCRNNGYYTVRNEPPKPLFTIEDLDKFDKDSFIYRTGIQELESYKNNMIYFNNDIKFKDNVDRVLDEKVYDIAYNLIQSRSGYEYEGVSLEWCETVRLDDSK